MGNILVAFGRTMRATYNIVNKVQKATKPIRDVASNLRRAANFIRNPFGALVGQAVNNLLGDSIKDITDQVVSGTLTGLDLDGEHLQAAERVVDSFIAGNSPMFEGAIDQVLNTLDSKDDSGIGARQSLLNLSESLTTLFEAVDTPRNVIKAARGNKDAITKLIGDGKIAQDIKDFRVPMKDGRIVGIHGKKYLLLSFLNEFLNPRAEGVRLEAYYELPTAERDGRTVELKGATTLERSTVENQKIGDLIRSVRENARFKKRLDKKTVGEAGEEFAARLEMTKLADLETQRVKKRIQDHFVNFKLGIIEAEELRYRVNKDVRKLFFSLELLAVGGLGNLTDAQIEGVHKRSAATMRGLADYLDKTIQNASTKRDLDPDAGTPPAPSRGSAGFAKYTKNAEDKVFGWTVSGVKSDAVREMFTDTYINKLAERAVGPAYESSQQAYRDLLGAISDSVNEVIYEVRRLEDSIENCPFCVEVADDPQPVGVLPPIGDGNCYNIKYNGLFCYCKMDVATDEEINSVAENASQLAAAKSEQAEGEEG
jgi:hypothetical protein